VAEEPDLGRQTLKDFLANEVLVYLYAVLDEVWESTEIL
jgi:hypothetical protein